MRQTFDRENLIVFGVLNSLRRSYSMKQSTKSNLIVMQNDWTCHKYFDQILIEQVFVNIEVIRDREYLGK